jgi:hypothetical protein
MKQQLPRRQKPLFFSLIVHSRETTIIDVKEISMNKWHETMDILSKKGAIPKETAHRQIVQMIEKGL